MSEHSGLSLWSRRQQAVIVAAAGHWIGVMLRHVSLVLLSLLFLTAPLRAEEGTIVVPSASPAPTEPATATAPADGEGAPGDFKSLDQEVQSLKKEVLDLNRELFVLEEDLL